MSSQSQLLSSRRFLPLFVTQFLGAFNDNTFKNALVVLLTFQTARWTDMDPAILANLAAGVFILPFFLFSATAGQLADKLDKARLARLVKLLEMAIMGVAALGFWLVRLEVLFLALFLMGVHSTLFGPVKYALLPQHLKADELLAGNALVEAGTFVSILLGTLVGGLLAGAGHPVQIALLGLALAAVGYGASRFIPAAPAPRPDLAIHPNPLTETWRSIGFARGNRSVFLSILGISWIWFFGALFLAQFPAYAKDVLGGGETTVTLLLATYTLGVGLGSLACDRLSGHRVELGLVPLGSIGVTLFALDLALASPGALSGPASAPLGVGELLARPGTWRILVDLALIGVFGGFFIVPLYALVQLRSPEDRRARIIAANNIMNALFIVVGSLLSAGLLAAGLSIPTLFAVAAGVNALVAVYIYTLVPEFLMRFLVWLALHTVGRVRARGLEQLPEAGGALLVLETQGELRPLHLYTLMAACRRPVRIVAPPHLGDRPLGRFILGEAKALFAGPGDLPAVAGQVREALAAGQWVALAQPALTPAGLADDLPVPVFRLVLGGPGRGRWWLRVEPLGGGGMGSPATAEATS